MKTLLLLFTFLSTFYLQAQVVNIPDANFKAKLLQASSTNMIASTQNPDADGMVTSYNSIDTNSDGEIQVSEAQAIKFLNIKISNCSNISGIEDFINLKFLDCSHNQLTSINVIGLTNLQFLICINNQFTALNISGLINLQHLNCFFNQLPSLNISGLTNLKYLNCSSNELPSLDVSSLSNLNFLSCSENQIPLLAVSNLTNLEYLHCSTNQLSNLDVTNLINLEDLNCSYNQLSNLNVANLTNLQLLECSQNQIPSLNTSNLTNLYHLDCSNNLLSSLAVSNLTNLQYLNCSDNLLPSLNVNGLTNLQKLYCYNNQLPSLNVNGLINLEILFCSGNQLTSLNVSDLISLKNLYCSDNQLASLDVSNLTSLRDLSCSSNQIPSLNVNSLTNLNSIYCSSNQLSNLDTSNLLNLQGLFCNNNQLTSLNLSNSSHLNLLNCMNNQLTTLFIKNNNPNFWGELHFSNNPTLQFVCCDEADLAYVQNRINAYGYDATCNVNSYCDFTPGGVFYTINGSNKIDGNNNGCDVLDSVYPNLKFTITNGTITGSFISDTSGNYTFPVSAGIHTITPLLENLNYFTVSPTSALVTFPTATSPFIQDFCVTPNGTHHDLEVVIIPLVPARPGFDAMYKIKYKNKGTVTETATLAFNYNDSVLDLVSTTLAPNSQSTGSLSWNIGTITPLQSGEIVVTLNVNSPTETPAVNTGDVLNYSAIINGLNTDETPIDNTFSLNQTVVNSFDPNDKTCLEGNSINASMIGEYVHYKIRFENTGTFPAQNIVVKDMIDTAKFDISTLQMTDASHNCVTRISDLNKVEFIFENINLPFDDATNDGYVVFKIKTKNTLVVGNTISNLANIYFDYNFPIVTNTATSTFQVLQNDSFVFDTYFSVYPNPAQDVLNLNMKQDVIIYSLSIYSILGQQVQTITNPEESINVSGLPSGNYFIKIVTDKGISNTKFIKE